MDGVGHTNRMPLARAQEDRMPTSPDLEDLTRMTPTHLRDMWTGLGIPGDPPHLKPSLLRGIAWHKQKRTRGSLDAETRRLLKAAIRNAPDPTIAKRNKRKSRDNVRLRTGTTLVRTWRGRAHEVSVFDNGKRFRYRETEYASLSEIAREITGARWSGPRFFGLKKLKGTT